MNIPLVLTKAEMRLLYKLLRTTMPKGPTEQALFLSIIQKLKEANDQH